MSKGNNDSFLMKIDKNQFTEVEFDKIKKFIDESNQEDLILRVDRLIDSSGAKLVGTVRDYIELVRQNRSIYRTAWESLYRSVTAPGFVHESEMPPERAHIIKRQKIKVYRAFEDEFFGIEDFIDSFVEEICSGATRGVSSRNMIVILAPRQSGKTNFVKFVLRLLNLHSEKEPLYFIQGCNQRHDDPIWAIPYDKRKQYEKELGIVIDANADICLNCKNLLEHKYNNDFLSLPVRSSKFNYKAGIGYGVISVSDLQSRDNMKNRLFGFVDKEFDPEDPRRYNYETPVHASNRGGFEINEATSFNDEQLTLSDVNRITREKTVTNPIGNGLDYIDTVIIATGQNDKRGVIEANSTIAGRFKILKNHYPLSVYAEKQLYSYMLKGVDIPVHLHEDVFNAIATACCFSRYDPDITKIKSLGAKMEVYSGIKFYYENPESKIKYYIDNMRELYSNDGMFGLSPVFGSTCIEQSLPTQFHKDENNVAKLGTSARDNQEIGCLHWRDLLISMRASIKTHPDYKEKYDNYVKILNEAYKYTLEKIIAKFQSFLGYGFEEKIDKLLQKYVDNAMLDINKLFEDFEAGNFAMSERDKKMESIINTRINTRIAERKEGKSRYVADPFSHEEVADINLLEDVENLVTPTDKTEFDKLKFMFTLRREVVFASSSANRHGRRLTPQDVPRLHTGLKRYMQQHDNLYPIEELFRGVEVEARDIVKDGRKTKKIFVKNRVFNDLEAKRFQEMIDWMLEEEVYCVDCAVKTLNRISYAISSKDYTLK